MTRTKKGIVINGWLNIDKDGGMTSFKVVAAVRRILNAQKAGHAGTLDPMGTGILPIALGEATKTIEFAQNKSKTYRVTVKWGESTTTDDSQGEIVERSNHRPTRADIEEILPDYTGVIMQTPPNFSAIKVDGQRAYDLAREGEKLDLKPRPVTVHSIAIEDHTPDSTVLVIHCGKGTYMRSLARDMGQKLGCLGHIFTLRRLKVGTFDEKTAISLDELEKMVQSASALNCVLPVETALDDIPALALTEGEAGRLRNGQALILTSRSDRDRLAAFAEGKIIALARTSEKAVGLVEIEAPSVRPVKILNI